MSDFRESIAEAVEQQILREINKAEFFSFRFNWKSQLNSQILQEAWEMVDYEKIKSEMSKVLEKMVAEKVINMLAQEISTDLKSILSVKERREEIRSVARQHLKHLCKEVEGDD